MMRLTIGFVASGLAVGVAAVALVGPSLLAGPRGEAMLVAAPGQNLLQPASFDGAGCASTFLPEAAPEPGQKATGLRVMTVMMRDGHDRVSVAIREIPVEAAAPALTLILLVDAKGHIRFAGPAGELTAAAEQALDAACGDDSPAGI